MMVILLKLIPKLKWCGGRWRVCCRYDRENAPYRQLADRPRTGKCGSRSDLRRDSTLKSSTVCTCAAHHDGGDRAWLLMANQLHPFFAIGHSPPCFDYNSVAAHQVHHWR